MDAFFAGEYIKSIIKAFVLIINIPEDNRDIGKAIEQLRGIKSDIPYSYQTPFSTIRGTFLDKPLKKMVESKNETIRNLGDWIYRADKTLDTTKAGRKFLKMLGRSGISSKETKRLNIYGIPIEAQKAEGTLLAEFTGKTFLRVPVLIFYLFMTLEIPTIYKAFTVKDDKSSRLKNGFKQIAKSFVSVNSLIFGGAILGAVGSYAGATGSLVGLGAGSYLGSKTGKWVNNQIDKI